MKLDKQQQEAVLCTDKQILVIAGAGSGKTRVLTKRVEHLLESGIQPHNVVCITFTNLAAQEMIERLKHLPTIGDAFIGTIHGFANKIYSHSGLTYEIYTSEKQIEIMSIILEDKEKYPFLRIQRYLQYLDICQLVEMGKISEEESSSFLLPSESVDLLAADEEAEIIRKERNLITFNDLIIAATEYYNEMGWELEHLLVDEFQDTGNLEWEFVRGLKAQNLFLVADDKQAIYSFKGGNVEIMRTLAQSKATTLIKLENNYRNKQSIVDAAAEIVEQLRTKIDTDTFVCCENPDGGIFIRDNKGSLEKYLKQIKEQGNFKDWFILTRTNKQLFEVDELLCDLDIPVSIVKRAGLSIEDMKELMEEDTTKLMTVHMAKGLENKNVLMYGTFPRKVPPYMYNEEERRVLYVGMTRAESKLIVLS